MPLTSFVTKNVVTDLFVCSSMFDFSLELQCRELPCVLALQDRQWIKLIMGVKTGIEKSF